MSPCEARGVMRSSRLRGRGSPGFGLRVLVCAVLASSPVLHDVPASASSVVPPSDNVEIAQMYIPRLRDRVWGMSIFDEVTSPALDAGIGWFPGSSGPGAVGNFAVIGHRTTGRSPFYNFENLVLGDEIVVRTWSAWYVYTLTRQQIVTPQSTWVVDPIPEPIAQRGERAINRIITLVTCTPRGTTRQRWIWWGELTSRHKPEAPPSSLWAATVRTSSLESTHGFGKTCRVNTGCRRY
jgi:LPXTG-site transpeptidase (sortase) family protein